MARKKLEHIKKKTASAFGSFPLEPITLSDIKITPLTLPLGKLEYCDGNAWYPVATENYVSNMTISITGDVSGSGNVGAAIITNLNNTINKTSYQGFVFSDTTSFFDLSMPNGGNVRTKLRMGRTQPYPNGFNGFEFEQKTSSSGENIFSLNKIYWNPGEILTNVFYIKENTNAINFNSYLISGVNDPVLPQDAATKNYIDTKIINIDTQTIGQLSISRLNGYPFSSNVFLRGDGVWASTTSSSIDINTGTTGQLNISRLNGYPGSSNAFLRGDGTWILPYINNLNINGTVSLAGYGLTTSGNVNATTGSLIGNNLAAYNSSGINVQSPLYFTNLGTYPIGITDNSASSRIYFNNTNTSSFATGLIVQNNGIDAVEFGFNNVNNEGYVWASNSATLKFGTNFTKRIDIAGNSAKTTFYDGSTQCYIHPNSNYLNLRTANTYNSVFSTLFESNAGGETSSLVMNGDYMQFINPLDTLGFIFTDEDNSTMTSYVAYINGSGQFISSSKEQKHSLQRKEHKDYLDRLNQLNVYSYGLRYDILEDDSPQKKERKARKANELQVGLIAEEVLELFDNATNVYKQLDETQQTNHTHMPSLAINYNKLLCYTILAIQELTNRVAFLEKNDVKSLS